MKKLTLLLALVLIPLIVGCQYLPFRWPKSPTKTAQELQMDEVLKITRERLSTLHVNDESFVVDRDAKTITYRMNMDGSSKSASPNPKDASTSTITPAGIETGTAGTWDSSDADAFVQATEPYSFAAIAIAAGGIALMVFFPGFRKIWVILLIAGGAGFVGVLPFFYDGVRVVAPHMALIIAIGAMGAIILFAIPYYMQHFSAKRRAQQLASEGNLHEARGALQVDPLKTERQKENIPVPPPRQPAPPTPPPIVVTPPPNPGVASETTVHVATSPSPS